MNNKNPCNRCSPMARLLCTRNVDRGTEDISARRAPRPPLYGDDGMPAWVDGHYTDDAKRSPHIKKWRRWREACSCCHRVWLVFMGGKLRVRINGKCDQTFLHVDFCKKCKAFLARETGGRSMLSYRQLSWEVMNETERELARKANAMMFAAAQAGRIDLRDDVLQGGQALLAKLKEVNPSPVNAALLDTSRKPELRNLEQLYGKEECERAVQEALKKPEDPAGGITT